MFCACAEHVIYCFGYVDISWFSSKNKIQFETHMSENKIHERTNEWKSLFNVE